MSDIQLKPLPIYEHTLISNLFIDHHMPRANGEYVKVYIYMLRLITGGTSDVTIKKVAKQLNLIRSDVLRAIHYWRDEKLMEVVYEEDIITTIGFLNPLNPETVTEEPVEQQPAMEVPKAKKKKQARLTQRPQYSMEEMALYQEQEDFKELIYIAERFLKKPLTQQDVNVLLSFIDWLGLPIDVVEYLLEYCADAGHRNMRYIETVAMDWSDQNIRNVDQAKSHTEAYNKNYFRIFRSLGLGNRQPTPNQIKYMDRWIHDYNFAVEVIELACEKTIAAINEPELAYVDTILTRWHNKGIKSIAAVEELDRTFKTKQESTQTNKKHLSKNRFHNHQQRQYDYDDLEKKMDDLLDKRINGME